MSTEASYSLFGMGEVEMGRVGHLYPCSLADTETVHTHKNWPTTARTIDTQVVGVLQVQS